MPNLGKSVYRTAPLAMLAPPDLSDDDVHAGEPARSRPRPALRSPRVRRRHRRGVVAARRPHHQRTARTCRGADTLLGDICSVNVNWPPLQRPPDFNWHGWEHKRQHVMTFIGSEARVNLLVVPYTTYSALALMVLRRAAGLPVEAKDRDKPAFVTAGSILQAARQQRAADLR